MKTSLILAATLLAASSYAERLTLNGAGASFPAPVYQQWTYAYTADELGAAINYQSVGSGAGINQIKAGTIDFAGSDAPLTPPQCDESGLVQIPMLTGAVVPIVNLPRLKDAQLKLSNATLSAIFLGEITNWNDPRIAAENPDVKLPKTLPITVVHRSDSSGTTNIFTSYLANVSTKWKEKIGAGSNVKWPVGIGGQKNPGVCNTVSRIRGAIGYTEYTYALEAQLATVQLCDAQGKYHTAQAPFWPILGTTYILFRKDMDTERCEALKAYLRWCFKKGDSQAITLHYTPLPEPVKAQVLRDVLK
ncbi:MAG: phosphate ABC transporter substrate-binding protein PstS [Kiritimatiellae bacterium]|nr:phosphate ABC transporter substrate-binding protein PstS [Kiritimatiellia bacterium]